MNNIRYFGPLHKIDKWLKKKCSDVCEFFKLRLVFWTNKVRGF